MHNSILPDTVCLDVIFGENLTLCHQGEDMGSGGEVKSRALSSIIDFRTFKLS